MPDDCQRALIGIKMEEETRIAFISHGIGSTTLWLMKDTELAESSDFSSISNHTNGLQQPLGPSQLDAISFSPICSINLFQLSNSSFHHSLIRHTLFFPNLTMSFL